MKKISERLTAAGMVAYAVIAAAIWVPRLLGCQAEAVISGSMEPAISTGALIYVKRADFQEIKVSDVITYRLKNQEMKVTHRVVEKNEAGESFITKGDANDLADAGAVEYARVEGKVICSVPLLGYAAIHLSDIHIRAAVAGLLTALLLIRLLTACSEAKKRTLQKGDSYEKAYGNNGSGRCMPGGVRGVRRSVRSVSDKVSK